MRLISLSLNNFKGIKSFSLEPRGKNTNIYGDNATGKTTLQDSFLWLLFNKDSQNKTDFAIKTLDADGNEIHGLEHAVESVLDLDGKPLTLRKVYQEKWTKKRGAAKKEFTGHTTDYFIDGVPVKKSEYEARIANIASEDIFKLLTSPTYFNEHLHWKERREILLQVCGDIADSEVLDNLICSLDKDKVAVLANILNTRTIDDYQKIIKATLAKINKELEKIPVRINEAELALPDISTINEPVALSDDISLLKESIQKKNQELARLESGGEVAEKTKRLREIEAEILSAQMEARKKHDKEIRQLQEQLEKKRAELRNCKGDTECLRRTNADRKRIVANLDVQMEKLRAEWHDVNVITPDKSDACPTCGQPMPPEQVEKILAEFNRKKAERLEAINAQGKELKEQAAQHQAEIEETEQAITENEKKSDTLHREIESLEIRIESLYRYAENTQDTPELQSKIEEKTALEQEIESLKAGSAEAKEKVLEGIRELEDILQTLEECQAKVKMHKDIERRIEELKNQERELAAEYERLEGELCMAEAFIRQKVELLEEKINSKFEMARFKLFDIQVNGAISECCETTYQGVPFSSLNNGARINVGLDIIRTLAKHYNFYPPIFIDNREAITSLIDMGKQQVISLIVSEQDKELRVETDDKKQKEVG